MFINTSFVFFIIWHVDVCLCIWESNKAIGIEDYKDIEADIIQALENSKVGVIS
jgi:hypothetical protein